MGFIAKSIKIPPLLPTPKKEKFSHEIKDYRKTKEPENRDAFSTYYFS